MKTLMRCGFNGLVMPLILMKVKGAVLMTLVDTGSNCSYITRKVLDSMLEEKCPNLVKLYDVKSSSDTTNGSWDVKQLAIIKFRLGRTVYEHKFRVMDCSHGFDQVEKKYNIQIHFLLGSDFLVSHNMVIDYPGQALYTKRVKKVDAKNVES